LTDYLSTSNTTLGSQNPQERTFQGLDWSWKCDSWIWRYIHSYAGCQQGIQYPKLCNGSFLL